MSRPVFNIESLDYLTERGLNLTAVFDTHHLPPGMQQKLWDAGFQREEFPRLVLIGNGGGRIWHAMQEAGTAGPNPIDGFSVQSARHFIHDYLDDAASHFLYPGPCPISLIKLGELAGWSSPSPLGLGINSTYGLWFAYRVAFLTSAELPPTVPLVAHSPCDSCTDKPCIATCPVGAAHWENPFNVVHCYNYRQREASPCMDRCFSRLACPVGVEHQYTLAQLQHHYDLARRIE